MSEKPVWVRAIQRGEPFVNDIEHGPVVPVRIDCVLGDKATWQQFPVKVSEIKERDE